MLTQKQHEIHIIKNYKNMFEYDKYIEYSNSYVELISQFLIYTKENIVTQNSSYFYFIIKRGLETINHIFQFLIMYTKNFSLTMYHCKKSFFCN